MSGLTNESGARPALWKIITAYLLVYVIWGSTYLAIRFSVETIPPLLSGGIRFLAAGILLFGACFARTKKMPPLKSWKNAFIASLLPFVITYGLLTSAETRVPSSITGLIIALEPLWFCLVGWLFYGGKKPTLRHYIGIALGFAGICVLIAGDPNVEFSFDSHYTMWMLVIALASLTWVIGAFVAAESSSDEGTLTASGMQMLCGGAVMMAAQFALSAFTGEWPALGAFSTRSTLALIYLITFGSLVGYTSFLWLMRVEPANRVATHAFVNPIVAVLLGWLIGGEAIYMSTLLSMPLITLSIILMVWEKDTKEQSA
ncbi:MAG: EamA family transporter [Cloacibacillus sp.]